MNLIRYISIFWLLALSSGVWSFDFYVTPPGVVLQESLGRGSVNVVNNGNDSLLLRIKVLPSGEENEVYRDGEHKIPFIVSRPVRVLQAGETARVDIIDVPGVHSDFNNESIFLLSVEGLRPPAEQESAANRVGFSVEQVIPVFYRPSSVSAVDDAAGKLMLGRDEEGIFVRNQTSQVVRLSEEVTILPGDSEALFVKTYVLPGDVLRVVSGDVNTDDIIGIRYRPVTYTGTLGAEAELLF